MNLQLGSKFQMTKSRERESIRTDHIEEKQDEEQKSPVAITDIE